MSQWMTSGASRLRAKQNRSFASRAQLRAVAVRISNTRSTASIPGQRQATRRRRIAVGETVSSSSNPMYRTGEIAQVNGHSQSMPFTDGGHPAFNDINGQRRRIRDASSSIHVLSRQVLDKCRRDLGLLSPSNSRLMSLHSLAPRTSSGNPFDAALQAIDDVQMRLDMTPASQTPQANKQYQMSSPPRYEHSNAFIQTSQNQPSLSFARLYANQTSSLASPSSTFQSDKQTTGWDAWSPGVIERQSRRRQGLRLPPRSGSRVTEAEGFVLRSPQSVPREFVVQRRSNLMDQFRGAAENMPRPDSCASGKWSRPVSFPSRPLKRGSEYSSDSSASSTGSRKQPRLEGFGLNNDRNTPDTVPSFFLDVRAGEQKRVGGIARFKVLRVGQTSSPRNVAGQTSVATTLPSQHKSSSIIDDGHWGPRVAPLCSLEKRNRQAPALRFFNNGVEVDINGHPVADAKPSSKTTEESLCKNVDKPITRMYRRTDKKDAPDRSEVVPEREVLADLEERQKSIWTQLTAEAEEARSRRKSEPQARKSPEEAATARWEIDPTPSALSSDPSKLASAGVDDIVRDSLKEREKTLSAASVLMEFMRKTEPMLAQE